MVLLGQQAMPEPEIRSISRTTQTATAGRRLPWGRAGCAVAAALLLLGGCEEKRDGRKPSEGNVSEGPASAGMSRQLASARLLQARECRGGHALDEALVWAVAAWQAYPASEEARKEVAGMMADTRWPLPVWELDHGIPVDRLAFSSPGTLWVALGERGLDDAFNTLVRWDMVGMKIESVLFPAQGEGISTLISGAKDRSLFLQRGSGDGRVTLLCDSKTLRPVKELGAIPPEFTPEAMVVESPSGMLFAHPEVQPGSPPRHVWRIRDTSTGEIVRSSDPVGAEVARPVAAWLDERSLRVLLKDGAVVVVPVSPVEPVLRHRPSASGTIVQARFSADGNRIMGLWAGGDGQAPRRKVATMELATSVDPPTVTWHAEDAAPTPAWWETPWNPRFSWWDSLLRDHGVTDDPPAVRIANGDVVFGDGVRAPVRGNGGLTAVAFGDDTLVTGSEDGRVVRYGWLPRPGRVETPPEQADPALAAEMCAWLTGLRLDPEQGTVVKVGDRERSDLLERLAAMPMIGVVPGVDPGAMLQAGRTMRPQHAPAAAWQPLWERLAKADATGRSWPRWLQHGQNLGDSRWHQDLTEAVAIRERPVEGVAGDASPWLAQRRMREAFAGGDEVAVFAALAATGGKGPAMATALALSLETEKPSWIRECLKTADAPPPFLRALAESRIAWIEKRPADALSFWPDEFPDLAKVRALQDWNGWEQADFGPRYAAHLKDLREALRVYDITAAPDAAERAKRAAMLLEPATRVAIGRRRLADLCLKGALLMADKTESPELVQQLAKRGRDLGAAAEPCLRVEALTHTRLKNHAAAHPLWIKLLTEYPVENHISGDYAEAAYTALETGNAAQAMEILTTGINRFGQDAGFSLRAGWIALLTGNHGRAYQYLLTGLRVGFAPEQEENACLLLAVAASLAGFPEDAATHFLRLVEIEPEWEKPETADTLDWPEELRSAIRQLISGGGPVIDLPGNPTDPTMEDIPTDPTMEELPDDSR